MHRFSLLLMPVLAAGSLSAAGVSGASALEFTKRAVDFGPRPAGSDANHALQNYILAQLKTRGCEIAEDAFTATPPKGPVAMSHLIAKLRAKVRPARPPHALALTAHSLTQLFPSCTSV